MRPFASALVGLVQLLVGAYPRWIGCAPEARQRIYFANHTSHVDTIALKLDELHARVALEAHVLDLLRIDVGVSADLRGVDLRIDGVDAEALLKVRLDNLAQIVDRVMSTIESNPQILDGLVRDLGRGLDAGAGALRRAT